MPATFAEFNLRRPRVAGAPPWLSAQALPALVPAHVAGFDIGIRCYCSACAAELEPDAVTRALAASEARTEHKLLVAPCGFGSGVRVCHRCRVSFGSDD